MSVPGQVIVEFWAIHLALELCRQLDRMKKNRIRRPESLHELEIDRRRGIRPQLDRPGNN